MVLIPSNPIARSYTYHDLYRTNLFTKIFSLRSKKDQFIPPVIRIFPDDIRSFLFQVIHQIGRGGQPVFCSTFCQYLEFSPARAINYLTPQHLKCNSDIVFL